MGKPAETANDAGMELGICHEFIVAISARQLHASFLIDGIFRVHERHIEEAALLLRHLPVEPAPDGAIGDGAGSGIRLVGTRLPPEHVAGELIEHDNERERSLRRRLPMCKPVLGSRAPELTEAGRDLGIEREILG